MELEDVDNVHLKLHPMVYTNKTWTPRKLLLRIRRDVILDILSQVGHSDAVHGNRRACTAMVTSLECSHKLCGCGTHRSGWYSNASRLE